MRIGVIGLGFMGSTHLQAYMKIPNAQLAAVASSDERKLSGDLSSIQGNLDIGGQKMDFGSAARYRNVEDLLKDPNVEAVDLCVPTHQHAPLAIQALRAGKHVLVEKPMALDGQECRQMIEAARQNDRVLMVAQVLRFWPDYVAAREEVRSGRLGSVQTAFFRRKCASPKWGKWQQDAGLSGGGVFDLLIHDIDYCIHLFGSPSEVRAVGVEDMPRGIDQIEAHLVYDNAKVVSVSGGWYHPDSYPFSMEFTITCERGTLDFNSQLKRLTLYDENGEARALELEEKNGFEAELQAFVDACEKGHAAPECPPAESALAVEVTLAMLESRQTGQPQSIQPA